MYKYKIHVLNRDINFDPTYKNVIQFFNPTTKTKDYTGVFTTEELTFNASEENINFDLQDGVNASVVLDFTGDNVLTQFGASSVSINDALNRQYCIIEEGQYNDETEALIKSKLYFYFITDYSILNESLIKYTLQLDAFTTYPLFSDIDISKTRVSRAHVDRFDLSNNFNLNNRFLQTGEPIDNSYNKSIKTIIDANFIPNGNFKQLDYAITANQAKTILSNTKWLYIVLRNEDDGINELHCAPIAPAGVKFYVSTDDDENNYFELDAKFMYNQYVENAKVINAFISPLSPFGTYTDSSNSNSYYIAIKGSPSKKICFTCPLPRVIFNYSNKELTHTSAIQFYYTHHAIIFKNTDYQALNDYISYFQTENIKLFDMTITPSNTFDYSKIEEAEIKLKVRQAYNSYKVKTELDESELKIDLLYLKTNNIYIQCYNNFSPNTNGQIAYTANNMYNIDNIAFTKTLYTPIFYSDKFNEYKATNANYELTGIATPMITGTLAGTTAGAKLGGIYGAIAGFVVGAGASAIKVYTNYDNMQKTPDSVKFKGQNINIDNFVKDYFFFIEKESLRAEELRQIAMYLYEFGYNISDIVNPADLFTRSSFNYLQLENGEKDIHALINKKVLDVVIKALNDGVRFWTKTHYIASKFEYTTNNLEAKLLT